MWLYRDDRFLCRWCHWVTGQMRCSMRLAWCPGMQRPNMASPPVSHPLSWMRLMITWTTWEEEAAPWVCPQNHPTRTEAAPARLWATTALQQVRMCLIKDQEVVAFYAKSCKVQFCLQISHSALCFTWSTPFPENQQVFISCIFQSGFPWFSGLA